MANEIRLRNNNISGTTTDNPLTNVATTINSPGFVDLPVVNTTNHLILILDPLEVAGAAEIVTVTAHTAASAVVTVTRGVDGSIARTHSSGTTWFHGPVASDWNYTQRAALSTNRPAAPFEGELIYETDTNKYYGYTGTDWAPRDAGGQLGYAQVTANQGGITTGSDLTGLTTTVTVGAGRRVKISAQAAFLNNAANDQLGFRIQEGAAVLQECVARLTIVNAVWTMVSLVVITPSAGAHTYKLQASRDTGAGTVQMIASAVNIALILVEDIGAA